MKTEKIKIPLKLTSKDRLTIHFLGTGSAFSKKNFQNNLILIKGKEHLMVDIGARASQVLYAKGLRVTDIRNYLITHQHADHIGGLEEVALMFRYFLKQKPDLIIPHTMEKEIWNETLKGGIAYNENPELKLKDIFNVINPKPQKSAERTTYEIKYKSFDLLLFKTNHIPDNAPTWKEAKWTSGLIIDKRILFSCDTKFDPEMIQYYNKKFNIEIIFHDCQFFTGGVHASYQELKTLPADIKKKILLTHYADNWESFNAKADGFMGFTSPDVYYIF